MVTVTVDIPNEINRQIEHFKIDNDLKDKREAIVLLLKKCLIKTEEKSMDELFKEVNKMKPIKLCPKELVRMKREVYSQ